MMCLSAGVFFSNNVFDMSFFFTHFKAVIVAWHEKREMSIHDLLVNFFIDSLTLFDLLIHANV